MYDVIVVGGGPSGLNMCISLKKLKPDLKVGLFEKAEAPGGHLMSGMILQKDAYERYAKGGNLSSDTLIKREGVLQLSERSWWDLSWAVPPSLRNVGNTLVSINEMCVQMASEAQALGVKVHLNSGITSLVVSNGSVIGATTAGKVTILSKHTVLAEGAHGTLASKYFEAQLPRPKEAQTFALGIREEWAPAPDHLVGTVWHTMGWPATQNCELGGGFAYFYKNYVAVGYVLHLAYRNGYVCPYKEFAKFKSHPLIGGILEGREKQKYAAKLIATAGVNSVPEVCFPGCTVIGCSAGLTNILKLKGAHNSLHSGRLAAEKLVSTAFKSASNKTKRWLIGPIKQEIEGVRNTPKMLRTSSKTLTMLEHFASTAFKIKLRLPPAPADNTRTSLCSKSGKLPKDWSVADFRSEELALANLSYNRAATHLSVNNELLHKLCDLRLYDKLTTRLCPAKVYSWTKASKHYVFKIQHENCVQCKSCCIKPSMQTISWNTIPEGGPNYN
ncbi:electron-transfer flavoprotein:ubiquinone oxidoreductase [Candidatus Hodgkinia cicadicola]